MGAVEQKVIVRWRHHESGFVTPSGGADVSMKHVNGVTNGINLEVGAIALNEVVSAVTGRKTLEGEKRTKDWWIVNTISQF